ncbi:MAG: hypothetical protein KJ077_51580 [Anaerolineae bacterium]|nr:hypothetical protein [Anaerolineae bacterium]
MAKIPTAGPIPVTFEAGPGFVTAVIHIDNSTLGVKFVSPVQLLTFFTGLMEHAAIAWPNDPFIQMYQEDETKQ